ncbi:MAG: ATPase, T2SS/T4P/T4SS family [Terriglobia bacterium]
MSVGTDNLAKILVERQLLAPATVQQCLSAAEAEGAFLEQILLHQQVFNSNQLLQILENHHFCSSVNLQDWPFDSKLLSLLPHKMASRYLALPIGEDGEAVKVAFASPDDTHALNIVSYFMHRKVIPLVALRPELKRTIEHHYTRLSREINTADQKKGAGAAVTAQKVASEEIAVSAKSIKLNLAGKQAVAIVEELFEVATRLKASDIHVQPEESGLVIRFRMDGILYTVAELPKELIPSVTSRIKILGNMDVAERRIPQDGRHTIQKNNLVVDLRLSCLPSQFGEKIVIRLLSKSISLLNLENLRMPPALREMYQSVIDAPQGFYLVAGPTGSGKTTTLYATLNAMDRESMNVITLENPIEYCLPKVTQVQIHEEVGLTFASGLRSVLRQDPDVVLVGEIRDIETVEIACRAALTGHKVLSTIHTNDASQAITRLLDMGTPPFLITATVRGVLSQRLVRVVCDQCKEAYPASETELALLGYPKNKELHRGRGCQECGETGYRGRMALFELLKIDDNLHRLILERASPYTIRHAAQRNGMVLMAEFAKKAVLDGSTTLAEVQRVVLGDEGKEQLCRNCQRVVSLEFAVCPFCQNVLKEKCSGCGNPIELGWEACPNCGHEVDREWQKNHCRHCLAVIDPQLEICVYCGGDVR